MISARSYLYLPGDRPDRLAKAIDRAGDAVIADLEDAVAPDRKDQALTSVIEWSRDLRADHRPQVWVRVNPGERMTDEIQGVVRAQLAGIVVPKANVAALAAADAALSRAEREQHLRPVSVALAALVESAQALQELAGIAASPRVTHLMIGEVDLAADLGIIPSADDRELFPIRIQLVVASAAAGLAPPTGPVLVDIRDLGGLKRSTESLRRQGFGARSALHPDQVPVIEAVFTPSPEEVRHARALLASHDGQGGGLDAGGKFVDEAVLRSARRTVAGADRLGL